MEIQEKKWENIKYLIRYPDGYKSGDKCPVIFFLHGAGSRGEDMSALSVNPFFVRTAEHEGLPFVSVAPLCTKDCWFDMFESVIAFVRHIYDSDFTDKTRFYGMGVSMGGYGIWQLAMSVPELFAAIVPICGGGMYWNAVRLKNVPVWAHHGDSDTSVFPEESKKMVDAVNKKGGAAKLTIYENCDHDSWTPTFKNREVFNWLLANTNKNALAEKTAYNDANIYG